jgi:radical SAM/Cys-rich protein
MSDLDPSKTTIPEFSQKLTNAGLFPLTTKKLEIFQINLGKMCNQTCKHCHVDAGPTRKEIMSRETLLLALKALEKTTAHTVDLTGGAPEMNPHFRWFVEELSQLGRKTMVRCNLTIIRANPSYQDLPQFYARNNVHVVSSLPFFEKGRTDKQRGDGVFEKSIEALKMLNQVGYGMPDSKLELDLVYNPNGAFLPGSQVELEVQFKKELKERFGIHFHHLFAITNMPISRFLTYLLESGNYSEYMEKLVQAFNPVAASSVMCRNTLSVGWEGTLYDCDFNQMLELPVNSSVRHLKDFDPAKLEERSIVVGRHCYGCTAGAGSSCGGTTAVSSEK